VWHSQVRFAWGDEAEPTEWIVQVVSSTMLPEPCGGPCSGSRRCHTATNDCQSTTAAGDCEPECGDGTVCFEIDEVAACGEWVSVGNGLDFLAEGSGMFADSARFNDNNVAISWYDHTRGNLIYAATTLGTFDGVAPIIVDGEAGDGSDTGDVGWFGAITIDATDAVHFTYVDATRDALVYRALGGDAEIIDSGVRGEPSSSSENLVGDDSSLVVLPDGTLQVAYMDSTRHHAMVSYRPVDAGWTQPEVVMGGAEPYDGAFGFYLSQSQTSDAVWLISYRLNPREGVRDVVARPVD